MNTSDRIALIALALSLGSVAYNFGQWIQGADVRFSPPRIVQLQADCQRKGARQAADEAETGGKAEATCVERRNLEIVGDSLSYANLGQSDMNAAVLHEQVELMVEGRNVELHWKYFTNYVESQSGRNAKVVSPRLVPGGGVLETHETEFTSQRRATGESDQEQLRDSVPWRTFTGALVNTPRLELKFRSFVLENGRVKQIVSDCRAEFTDERVARLQDPRYGRVVLSCLYTSPPRKSAVSPSDLPERLGHFRHLI